MKKANIVTGLIVIVAALAVILYTYFTFPGSVKGVPGPGVFPILIASLMLFSGIIVLVDALRSNSEEVIVLLDKDNMRVYITMGILAVYILMVQMVGFVVSSTIFMTGMIRWFSGKKLPYCAAWGVGLSAVVYAAFTYLLKVSLNFGFLI